MPEASLRVLAWPACRNRPYNPYNWLLSTHLTACDPRVVVGEFTPGALMFQLWDIWHMHWPEKFLRITRRAEMLAKVGALAALIRWAKLRGIRLVWTIHNLMSHERLYPAVEAWLRHWVVDQIDGAIALSESSAAAARRRFARLGHLPLAVIPHGHYIDAYPNTLDGAAARAALGLDPHHRVLLFIGQVRRYKNVTRLIDCVGALPDPDLRLVVAGLPNDPALAAEVRCAAQRDPRVQTHLALIPDARLQVFLNAADLVVLPYEEILNSGSALLALSFRRPVLVPGRGSMGELRQRFGERWVMTYDQGLTPATLRRALETLDRLPADGDDLERRLRREVGWDRIAAETVSFYRSVLGRDPVAAPGARDAVPAAPAGATVSRPAPSGGRASLR
ncbi:MAG: glycosyltransferase [Sphaerobacter sp.]|nr:glycosyltransferase [Sphaerobacter sp.]